MHHIPVLILMKFHIPHNSERHSCERKNVEKILFSQKKFFLTISRRTVSYGIWTRLSVQLPSYRSSVVFGGENGSMYMCQVFRVK